MMTNENPNPIPRRIRGRFALRHQALLMITMVFCTFVSLLLLGYRISSTHETTYSSLVWNLFLAWIPAALALAAYNIYRKGSCLGGAIAIFCAIVWLLFFPNAPYLLTDIVHLRARPEIPYWFDQFLYLAFAFSGCYLGLVSLLLMQALVRRSVGRIVSWVFAIVTLVLSGFGIYLGRFTRFNSWDVLVSPKPIFKEVLDWIQHPKSNMETFGFSIVFSLLFASVYFVVVAIVNLSREDRE